MRDLADRIIAIDPDSVDGLFQRGWIAWIYDGEVQEAARYFERAMRADPTDVNLLRIIVLLLIDLNRSDEAIALSNYLVLRDPSCSVCVNNLFMSYRIAGRHMEAVQALQKLLVWRPPGEMFNWSLGVAWLGAGYPENALAAFEKFEPDSGGSLGIILSLHDLGRMDEFQARFAEMREDPDQSVESVARVYAWIGDNDQAFNWLEKMVELDGPETLAYIDTDFYDKIKPDPRWRELRARYGYADDMHEEIEINVTLPAGVTVE